MCTGMVVEVHAFKAHMWKSKDKVIESAMWALGVELRYVCNYPHMQ